MYKNRFTAICLKKYSKSKCYFCTWGLLWQFDNNSVPLGNCLKMNSYTGRHRSRKTRYCIWNSSAPMAVEARFHTLQPIWLAYLCPAADPSVGNTPGWHRAPGVPTTPAQPSVLGPGTTCPAWPQGAAWHRGVVFSVTATDRGRKAGKRMMISPSQGVLQRTVSI